ncbi:coiled-coil domain-containing protein 171, partial [Austrofundulus limnaeus]|uniref:Coiled-coil domain-containing protein 171 n=1 Tax=Austrofundulus limnaeus TaxID=52670 RepID=A0A2I4AKV0_AUSLI
MQPGPLGRTRRGAGEENRRITEMMDSKGHREKQEGGVRKQEEKRGDAERRAASEGGEGSDRSRSLRWRINQLEKEKLTLRSSCNQEVCRLQAELARLRSSVERGQAQRAELQYQLTASRRDGERVAELSRDRRTLTERMAELQQTVGELQKALHATRQAREEDQHALQQEVEERDGLIQSFSCENQRLHRLLQGQEEALEESKRRMVETQREREEEDKRRAEELRVLVEKEERSRREKELREQELEEERTHRQEAQVSLELLRAHFREVERACSLERERSSSSEHALQRLQAEFTHIKSDMTVALETERKVTSDLSERLEEEKKQHAHTQQAADRQRDLLDQIRETLQRHRTTADRSAHAAKDDGKPSLAQVLQQLTTTLNWYRSSLEDSSRQVQDQQEEIQLLQQLTSDQQRQTDEARQESLKLEEEVTRLHQEGSDCSMQNQRLQEELQKKEEELQRKEEELQKKEEELQRKEEELQKKEEELQTEKEERREEVQKITDNFNKESTARLSFLHCLYQRLLTGCVLLRQPQSMLGDFTWKELCDVIDEQVDQLTSDLQQAKDKICHLQSVCDKQRVCVRRLQRRQEGVLSRLQESVRRREEAWSRQHTHAMRQLQSQLQLLRSQSEDRSTSLTSDLSQLQDLLSRSRQESSSFLLACALLCGALRHAHRCLGALRQQKLLLSRRLEDRELLEDQVRSLADALRGEEEEEGGGRR